MELKGEAMMEGVRTAMEALDCTICNEPLVPPIYQCGTGHLLCKSCRCPSRLCASPIFTHCFDMERVVEAIEVPCCFAKNDMISITIDTELAYDDEKLEDEDSEDESFDEDRDDEDD